MSKKRRDREAHCKAICLALPFEQDAFAWTCFFWHIHGLGMCRVGSVGVTSPGALPSSMFTAAKPYRVFQSDTLLVGWLQRETKRKAAQTISGAGTEVIIYTTGVAAKNVFGEAEPEFETVPWQDRRRRPRHHHSRRHCRRHHRHHHHRQFTLKYHAPTLVLKCPGPFSFVGAFWCCIHPFKWPWIGVPRKKTITAVGFARSLQPCSRSSAASRTGAPPTMARPSWSAPRPRMLP